MVLSRQRGIIGVVTDRRRLLPGGSREAQVRALAVQASAAAAAGVDVFQVRERDLEARELSDLVGEILEAVTGSLMRVLVNDRLDVAITAGAHGVHLPGSGLPPSEARAIAPAGFLIGQSIHGTEHIGAGADFAVFGTVFPTASKVPGHTVAGTEALAITVRRASVPVLAIGGVTESTVATVAALCDGVAAIGWFGTTDGQQLSESVRRARLAFDTTTRVI